MVTTVTLSWALAATVVPACVPRARGVDVTSQTAVTSLLSSWRVFAVPATEVHTHTHTREHAVPSPSPPAQVPGVRSALRDTSGTRRCPAGAACPASATATSTCTTPGRATPRRAPASGACTTPRATPASTARPVTTATLPRRAAGVSVPSVPGCSFSLKE